MSFRKPHLRFYEIQGGNLCWFQKSALFTDGQSGCCLELILGKGRNWRESLTKLFDRLYPNKWAFFIAELEQVSILVPAGDPFSFLDSSSEASEDS